MCSSDLVAEQSGKSFPQEPLEQLWGAIRAVFSSWMNHRASVYRHLHNIPESWGTAVTVQAMVFGNMDSASATGVAFTRNPSSGVKELYGEYLVNAQGEDVVSGRRSAMGHEELAHVLPDVWRELCLHTEVAKTTVDLPFRKGLTVLSKFEPLKV